MEPDGKLLRSQTPTTYPYNESDYSSSCLSFPLLEDPF